MSRLTKSLLRGCVLFLLTVACIEIALRLSDPLGLKVEYDKSAFANTIADYTDGRGYGLRPGVYDLHNWRITVGDDGNRVTPASVTNGNTVYFVGDSVTMGWGVDDAETWVNHVTSELQLNAVNRGVWGYSITNVKRDIDTLPDNARAVYLLFSNDAWDEYAWYQTTVEPPPMVSTLYVNYITGGSFARRVPYAMDDYTGDEYAPFWATLAEIDAMSNVFVIAFDDMFTREIVKRGYGVHVIPYYTQTVSFVDAHASVAGNVEIAASVVPILAAWLGE